MDAKIKEIAERVKGLREMSEISISDMAQSCDVSETEYVELETGAKDFSLGFLCKAASKLGVDFIDLMSGESPRLQSYQIVRKNQGLAVKRRETFNYKHLAYLFKNKKVEPFLVEAPFIESEQNKPIHTNFHPSQEFDLVLKGSMKISIDGHEEILHAGDTIFYDSTRPHGMIAVGEKNCLFLAVVIK